MVQHGFHTVELVGVDEAVEKMRRKLNGNFTDVFRVAVGLLPHVFKVGARNKYKVVFGNGFHRIAHNAPQSRSVFDEIQFKLLVAVDRVGKLFLVAVNDVKAVFV